ncbi:MAG: sensor histidine kinase KdpD [Alphaproteobacteria bacterium]|nr:sensor histidine kinase KdpD [Alphaproteobacteria bacterium]
MEQDRPNPDALLAATAREGRGRLKIFLGAAPGVGKTWEMLSQAKRRQGEGVNVLAGVIETHGRAETGEQAKGIPELPLRRMPYRGQDLAEFDLDEALARRPGLLLVDELAHSNAPGSRHAKRWEDVEEMLAAGLDVWATLNVQHLESLNEDIARIAGVRVTETLPDRVLELADEIELVDLTPAALRERLKAGHIYRADVAERALEGFFKEGNLGALREIALRRVAEHVDEHVRDWMRANRVAGPWPTRDRVLALVGPDAAGQAVIRYAKRLADALRAPWIVLHVERATDSPDRRPSLALATQLGAEVETRAGPNLVRVALDVARARNVTHLVIGRAPAPFWRRWFGRTLGYQLLRRTPEFALHVTPSPALVRRPAPSSPAGAASWVPWLGATALVAGVTGAGLLLSAMVPQEALGMVFLAAVVGAATLQGLRLALYTAAIGFLAWDFFFIPPIHTITIANPHDAIGLAVFLIVASVTGVLAGRLRAEARAGQARIDGLRRIGAFSRKLGEPTTEAALLAEIARQAAAVIDGPAAVLAGGEGQQQELHVAAVEPEGADGTIDQGGWAAARRSWTHGEPTGRGTATLPGAAWRFLPLRTARGRLAVLGVDLADASNGPCLQALDTLADQAAAALERVRLTGQAARAEAAEETQRLRTALLNSLSHDLRTPLTGIRGAAGTLRGAWDTLPEATRADLLAGIEHDVARMTRFLADIMELTRLESGEIRPRILPASVGEVIELAIGRVPDAAFAPVNLAQPAIQVLADPALLEQALVNVIENAVKYGSLGSAPSIRASVVGDQVEIAVADEGVGIAAEDLPHVFDSFYRARRGDQVAPGTGLGLAIARGLVEAMGGGIRAESPRTDLPVDGSPGTIVTLRLPGAP